MNKPLKTQRGTGTVNAIERLPNSTNGNPRYCVRISGGAFYTAPDSDIAYGIEQYLNKRVTIEWRYWYKRPTITAIMEAAEQTPVPLDPIDKMRAAIAADWYVAAQQDSGFLYSLLSERVALMTPDEVQQAYTEMQPEECSGPGECDDPGCPAHYAEDK